MMDGSKKRCKTLTTQGHLMDLKKKKKRVKKIIYSTFWHVLYMQLGYLRYYLLLQRGIQYFPLFVHITYFIGEYTIPKQLSVYHCCYFCTLQKLRPKWGMRYTNT